MPTNRVGGRSRSGIATAYWAPAVVGPPAGTPIQLAAIAARAYAAPQWVDGRPVVTPEKVEVPRQRSRILVGGADVTYFRGVATPLPDFQLLEPLLYGSASMEFPQIYARFERLGVGDLAWLRPGAVVEVQRLTEAGAVAATDYLGVITAFDVSGASLRVDVGGEASGRAALLDRQVPLFRSTRDLGAWAFDGIRALGLDFTPRLGPVTGIKLAGMGGMSHLDYLSELCAKGFTTTGAQWSIMPTARGVYRLARKDVTTVHATLYFDDAYVVPSLRRDIAEEPNRIYGTGVTPDGMRVKFGAYPGLKQGPAPTYPMAGNAAFGQGTTNAQTTTGDGITTMIWRLTQAGYLDRVDNLGGYDADVTRAIRAVQDDAGLAETGAMNLATWRALYDLDATGYSLKWSQVLPAAEAKAVRYWNRSGSGAVIGRNPAYDPTALPVERSVDMGTGFTREQIREWSRAELTQSGKKNWVGTVTIETGAVIAGNHTPGTPITAANVLPARALRPGMNVRAPFFDGGTLLHVSGVQVSSEGTVTLTVDTRARDTMAVWEVITRNRESRSNPARAWVQQHRASQVAKDAVGEFDEVGGKVNDRVTIAAQSWRVFPVVAGQEGTIRRLRLALTNPTEFVCAVFGRTSSAEQLEKRLTALVPAPLTKEGTKKWTDADVQAKLDDRFYLLYVAGDDAQPCGYWPKVKPSDGLAGITGVWQDDAGFSYHTFQAPVVWVAVWANAATAVSPGRIMWPQLEAGA